MLITVLAGLEVLLFSFLGNIIDWLSTTNKDQFLENEGFTLIVLGGLVLLAIPLLSCLLSLVRHQTAMGNYPMRIRWLAHKFLLRQSFGFYQDECAGRVVTKVMQTALGVREAVMKLSNVVVYVCVYFPNAPDIDVTKGEIEFRNIHFNYGQPAGVIENFSLTIKPGEKIGIVGRSGAGKTTLMNVVLRLFDLEAGTILIDSQNISKVNQESLRSQIGVETQDTSLLHRSVGDNIAYGREDASEKQIIHAASKANAHEFICKLTDQAGFKGHNAQVGERGVNLSGGQRQRITLARVLLKVAPIFILDEATSALDSEVESAIQENLMKLMKGKTFLAVAHRLSTIAAMDRLIVIEKGQIVAQGTHNRLSQSNGLYFERWKRQSGGFLE